MYEEKGDKSDEISEKFQFQKAMRVTASIMRYMRTLRSLRMINKQLGLQKNENGVYLCHGRTQKIPSLFALLCTVQ